MADLNRRELLKLLAGLPFVGPSLSPLSFVGPTLSPLPLWIDARGSRDCPMIPGDSGWDDMVRRMRNPITAARSLNRCR